MMVPGPPHSDALPNAIIRGWLLFAALCGSITGVAFMKPLTWQGRLVNWFVGFSCAVFVGPALTEWWHIDSNSKASAAVVYVVGVLALSAFPPLLKWAASGGILRTLVKEQP